AICKPPNRMPKMRYRTNMPASITGLSLITSTGCNLFLCFVTFVFEQCHDSFKEASNGGTRRMAESEIIFEVREDEADGGYVARALGHSIFTQGDSLEELRAMVKDAMACHFANPAS